MEKQAVRVSGYPDTRVTGNYRQMKMKARFPKLILYLAGSVILVLGIALILRFWADAVLVFRAGVGMVLALAGLLILYSLGRK